MLKKRLCIYFFLMCGASILADDTVFDTHITQKEYEEVRPRLPLNVQAILEKELKASNNWTVVIHQAEEFVKHVEQFFAESNSISASQEALAFIQITFARIFQEARVVLAKKQLNGTFVIDIGQLIEQSYDNPLALNNLIIKLDVRGNSASVIVEKPAVLDAENFEKLSLTEIEGKRFAVIGIGGGSDCIQATQLAMLLPKDKEIGALISVRNVKPSSTGTSGKIDGARTITHAQTIMDGVYLVSPQSTGSGRFFENLPAEKYPTYLVIDENNESLLIERIAAALHHAGGVDSILAVDTGGDALYPLCNESQDVTAHSTPDQDLRVLQALAHWEKNHNVITAEIAVGVDSPQDAQQILHNAHAQYCALTDAQKQHILAQYKVWGMDGSHEGRYGKTSLTWQAALQNMDGLYVLPLPKKVVIDAVNPWIPFVLVTPSMAGIFFMKLSDHLHAIGA